MFLTEERLAISFIGFQIYDFHLAKTSHRFTGHVHWAEMSGVADTLCDWQQSMRSEHQKLEKSSTLCKQEVKKKKKNAERCMQ